jgi:GxxExxY protein
MKNSKKELHEKLSREEEVIAKHIVDAAFQVHKELGPGLLESIYETCFCHELAKSGVKFERQVLLPVVYDGITFDEGLRLDVLVDKYVICELKAVDKLMPVHTAQVLSYLKLTNKRLGFLINFNVPIIKTGIKRIIL